MLVVIGLRYVRVRAMATVRRRARQWVCGQGWSHTISGHDIGMFYPAPLVYSNNFEGSSALAEVCALLSAVLVFLSYMFIFEQFLAVFW